MSGVLVSTACTSRTASSFVYVQYPPAMPSPARAAELFFSHLHGFWCLLFVSLPSLLRAWVGDTMIFHTMMPGTSI